MTSDNVPLLFAAFALIAASLSPVVVWIFTRRATIADRDEEHRRQDAVAAKAAEAAALLAQKQDEIAAQAAEAARLLNARQNEVAEIAAEAAKLLAKRQNEIAAQAAEAARLLVASNDKIATAAAEVGAETKASLNQIHTLVNSNLTTAQKHELEATKVLLVALRELMAVKEDRGIHISNESIAQIADVEQHIDELARDLAHKNNITEVAERNRQIEGGHKDG